MKRTLVTAFFGGLALIAVAATQPVQAAPLAAASAVKVDAGMAEAASYRKHHHLRGPKWRRAYAYHHDHCGDWHRCHYYFYGYKQWRKWNPGSRAYFYRRYHHY
jgi:hypothetical protein